MSTPDMNPVTHAERREAFAKYIYEYWNPDVPWSEAHSDDLVGYRVDADIAMAAADAFAGAPSAQPTRADIYLEVADRLALYADTQRGDADVAARIADKVREWGRQATGEQQPVKPDIDRLRAEAEGVRQDLAAGNVLPADRERLETGLRRIDRTIAELEAADRTTEK